MKPPSVTHKAALLVTAAIMKVETNKTVSQITNPNYHTYTIDPGAVLASFTVLTPNRAKKGQTRATGTTQFNQSIPGRSTSDDRLTAPRVHLQ